MDHPDLADRWPPTESRDRPILRFADVWRELAESPLARVPDHGSERLLATVGGVLEAFTNDEVALLAGYLEQLADALDEWLDGGAVPVRRAGPVNGKDPVDGPSDTARSR